MSSLRFVIAWLLLAAIVAPTIVGQEPEVEVQRRGDKEFNVRIAATRVSGLTLLSTLAERFECEMSIGDPELAQELDEEVIDVSVSDVSGETVIDLIGAACGVSAKLDVDAKKITARRLPARDAEDAREFFRKSALRSLFEAYGGDEDPAREVELLRRSAELYLAGGDFENAYGSLQKFLVTYKDHDMAPEACLLAGRAALAADDAPRAARMADTFIREYSKSPGYGQAQILAARAMIAQNEPADAVTLLRGLARVGRRDPSEERTLLVAELLLAEIHYDVGDFESSLGVLNQIASRHDGTQNRDLLGQVPLFTGLCRRASGEKRHAVDDLRVAAHTCPTPALRIRSLLEQARIYLDMGAPFEALAATRVAMALEPSVSTRLEARRLEALARRDLGLTTSAVDILLELTLSLPDAIPSEKDRMPVAIALMRELGSILFSLEEWALARKSFETLQGRPELEANATYMIAECDFREGEFKRALERLDSIPSGVDEELTEKIRRLRGDCYMRLTMFEKAIDTWSEEERR